MLRILKEPFVHFILIGITVFITSYLLKAPQTAAPEDPDTNITVPAEIVETMGPRGGSESTGTDQTTAEPQNTLDSFVKAEIFYREGLARNLDKDDPIVRSRLIEKMTTIAMEQANAAPVSESKISAYYKQNVAAFSWPARASIIHIYFDKKKRGAAAKKDCETTWQRVLDDPAISPDALLASGDRKHGMRSHMQLLDTENIVNLFGAPIADKIISLQAPNWIGPMESSNGWHIIRVIELTPGGTKPLSAVRSEIEKKIETERNEKAVELFYESLKKKYQVLTPGVTQ